MTLKDFINDILNNKYELVQGGCDRIVVTDGEYVYKMEKRLIGREAINLISNHFAKTSEELFDSGYLRADAFTIQGYYDHQNLTELDMIKRIKSNSEDSDLIKLLPETEEMFDGAVLKAEYCGPTLKNIVWFSEFMDSDLTEPCEAVLEQFSKEEDGESIRNLIYEIEKWGYSAVEVAQCGLIAGATPEQISQFTESVVELAEFGLSDCHWDNVCYHNGQFKIIDLGVSE